MRSTRNSIKDFIINLLVNESKLKSLQSQWRSVENEWKVCEKWFRENHFKMSEKSLEIEWQNYVDWMSTTFRPIMHHQASITKLCHHSLPREELVTVPLDTEHPCDMLMVSTQCKTSVWRQYQLVQSIASWSISTVNYGPLDSCLEWFWHRTSDLSWVSWRRRREEQ